MGAPSGSNDSANRGSTNQTRLAGTHVDAVFELEEAGNTVGIDVIRDGGASELDCLTQDQLQRGVQPVEPGAGEAARHSGWPDACMEEALVGIDVPDAMEKLLVQQSGLDREPPVTEERGEVVD